MVVGIEAVFPRLRGADYRVTSPADDVYNCIAWAAGATDQWWWPLGAEKTFWPAGVPRDTTVRAFREAFATLGYAVCADEELEPHFEKIALFANDDGVATHAARQLPDGRWTSKLGKSEDIEHALHDLEGATWLGRCHHEAPRTGVTEPERGLKIQISWGSRRSVDSPR